MNEPLEALFVDDPYDDPKEPFNLDAAKAWFECSFATRLPNSGEVMIFEGQVPSTTTKGE